MIAVIFDMDGVIFDSERLVLTCWQQVADAHGIEGITGVLMQCLGVNEAGSKAIMLEHFGPDFPYADYQKEVSMLYHQRADHGKLPLKPGIRELLTALQRHGVKTAVASSTRSATVRQQLKDGGLLPYFHKIIGGEMVSRSKPAPDIFLLACEKLGIRPGDACVIEDSFNGVRAAAAAGIPAIMVPDLMEPDEEIRRLASVVLPSLTDVIGFLKMEK